MHEDQPGRGANRQSPGRSRLPRATSRLALMAVILGFIGCVERRMTIRTNVDDRGGALVVIDNREAGRTPYSTGFTFYADREIKLIADGYETTSLVQPIPAPWWDNYLTEIFAENVWPFTIRDERDFYYELPPPVTVTTNELLDRAQKYRADGQAGAEAVPGRRAARGEADSRF